MLESTVNIAFTQLNSVWKPKQSPWKSRFKFSTLSLNPYYYMAVRQELILGKGEQFYPSLKPT